MNKKTLEEILRIQWDPPESSRETTIVSQHVEQKYKIFSIRFDDFLVTLIQKVCNLDGQIFNHLKQAVLKIFHIGRGQGSIEVVILKGQAAFLLPFTQLSLKFWIRCSSRFNAGSRILENNLEGFYFSFSSPCRGTLTLWGPDIISFLTLQGEANLYLT